jgi:predicted ATP-grasp superfamily ATP-dependent carboligase
LENHADLVDQISHDRPLYGNVGHVLRKVRDPFEVSRCLTATGLEFPETRRSPAGLPRDGSWLMKSLYSSGGQGVAAWRGQPVEQLDACCFQRRMSGEACSAVMLAHAGQAEFLGTTRQLVGDDWCSAAPFHYCGSVGPLPLAAPLRAKMQQVATVLARHFSLRGIFGVDYLINGQQLIALEINPRYPASAEVLERVADQSLVAAHVRACEKPQEVVEWSMPQTAAPRLAGKCILFAQHDFTVTAELAEQFDAANNRVAPWYAPRVADIPAAGSNIRAGAPVVTLLDDGDTEEEVHQRLQARAATLYAVMAAL